MTFANPADLFLALWNKANDLTSFQRMTAPGDKNLRCQLDAALNLSFATMAAARCWQLIADTDGMVGSGSLLTAMHAIDDIFSLIHPRCQFGPARHGPNLPKWLRELRDRRMVATDYAYDNHHRLVPRGPLSRLPRDPIAAHAECLADRFHALAVVPQSVAIHTRTIHIRQSVIDKSVAHGIPSTSQPGRETIAFVPVAEYKSHLRLTERKVDEQTFVDFRLAPKLNAADRVVQALQAVGKADIAFAPELVMREEHAKQLGQQLRCMTAAPKLIIAGSGQTSATNRDGQPWNEAWAMNAAGAPLWKQRKLWPAGIDATRARNYGLSKVDNHKLGMEDTGEGDTLVIADIDGMGRCLILICQDIQAEPLVTQVLQFFQPDWVFVPILDTGIKPGRWAHQAFFVHSELSNARFMAISSTALARLAKQKGKIPFGLAVGPKHANSKNHDLGRAIKSVSPEKSQLPHHGKLIWGDGSWQLSKLSSKKTI